MLLGLDLGTTNVKALVTDHAGQRLGEAARPVSLSHLGDGGVEQDLEEIWQATRDVIREALRALDAAAVQAIGVSSQGGAMQRLDAQGRPSGRVISWLDRRGQPFDDALTSELGPAWFAQRAGHGRAALAVGQLLRLRHEQPASLLPPNRVGFVGDVIVSRLCGGAAHDGTSASLTGLYNPERRDYDPELLARLGISAKRLPALLSPREQAGHLLPAIAGETGLPAGIPVSPAVHDQYAGALASGAVAPGTVMVGTGTAWVLLAVGDKFNPPVTTNAFVCHHLVDGLWGQIVSLANGGSALAWALELTGHNGKCAPEIDRLLESAPPGSDGLQCWPFLAGVGASGLPLGTRGRLSGVQLSHQPGHVIRAVVEGLAFELERQIVLLRQSGVPVHRLVLSGSATASKVTPQILAAVTQLPLACATQSGGSPLGAAIVARGLLEPAMSLADLARVMSPSAPTVEPGQAATFYHERFGEYLRSLPVSIPAP